MINRILTFFKVWRENRARKAEEKLERYWHMSREKADKVSFAIFYELDPEKAGRFMDEWERRNAIN